MDDICRLMKRYDSNQRTRKEGNIMEQHGRSSCCKSGNHLKGTTSYGGRPYTTSVLGLL
jgi:hypothetical protein